MAHIIGMEKTGIRLALNSFAWLSRPFQFKLSSKVTARMPRKLEKKV